MINNDERAEINQIKDDFTSLAQFFASFQGQLSEIGERLRKLEKKSKVIDGGNYDVPRHALKQGPDDMVVGKKGKKRDKANPA